MLSVLMVKYKQYIRTELAEVNIKSDNLYIGKAGHVMITSRHALQYFHSTLLAFPS